MRQANSRNSEIEGSRREILSRRWIRAQYPLSISRLPKGDIELFGIVGREPMDQLSRLT